MISGFTKNWSGFHHFTKLNKQMRESHYSLYYLFVVSLLFGISNSDSTIALIIINAQECFLSGPLKALESEQIIPAINEIRKEHGSLFTTVVLTQDLHCPNDVGLASQYPGKHVGETVNLQYNKRGKLCKKQGVTHSYAKHCRSVNHVVKQILMEDHCLTINNDSRIADNLIRKPDDYIIKKENMCHVDTYSAFQYKGRFIETGLDEYLQKLNVNVTFIVGLVLEMSVYFTAIESAKRGYATYVVIDATGISKQGKTQNILWELDKYGVRVIETGELPYIFKNIQVYPPSLTTSLHSRSYHFLLIFYFSYYFCKLFMYH